MSVLITGCAGFIGSHCVDEFLSKGIEVIGVDCFTYAGRKENMESFIDKIEFYELDICEFEKIEEIVQKHNVDTIINFAAETHVDNSIKSAKNFLHSNIDGVLSLLEVCRKNNVTLFQISTDEVYGSTRSGSFHENDKLNPGNPYSATKAAAEHLITSYHNTHGTKYKMVRMSNNFGPRQFDEKFIPTILRSLKNNKKIPIYGDGSNIRDWFYVKDCARLVRVVHEMGSLGETYNLTLSNEMTNLELVKNIMSLLEKNFDECVEFVKDRPGHDFRYSLNDQKIKRLDSSGPTDFQKALSETIEFYK